MGGVIEGDGGGGHGGVVVVEGMVLIDWFY